MAAPEVWQAQTAFNMSNGEGDGSKVFLKLIADLVQQYEQDVANAALKGVPVGSKEPHSRPSTGTEAIESIPELVELQELPSLPGEVTEVKAPAKEPVTDLHHAEKVEPLNVPKPRPATKARKTLMQAGNEAIESGKTTANDNFVSRIVRSRAFDSCSAVLLLSNAVFIGFQVQSAFLEEPPIVIAVIDWFFCVAFLIELIGRLVGYGCIYYWCNPEDRLWNSFDFVIVLMSTVDTIIASTAAPGSGDTLLSNISVLRVVRVVRIIRVLRVIRVMKFFQDLRILLAAIVSTLKTASFAFLLILLIMYMFGIALAQLTAEYLKTQAREGSPVDDESDMVFFFGSVSKALLCLFMTITGGIDWKDAVVPLMEIGPITTFLYLFYVGMMVLCIMNVLLGIFCQCALDTAANDKENVIQLQLQDKKRFVDTLQTLFMGWDDSGDGMCSLEEFRSHLDDDNTQALLRSLEIESRDAVALFELLDSDGSGEVDLNEFVTGCITLRGGAKAVHMEKVSSTSKVLFDRMTEIDLKVSTLLKANTSKRAFVA
mmetsp:Transcript_10890/g.19396  ORF Transcript_10890/g.19396 Transcript_10890/m.19396 type:complete len:543 (+) Transcript_10890:25-1653(+)